MVTVSRGKVKLAPFPQILVTLQPGHIQLSKSKAFECQWEEVEETPYLTWLEGYARKKHAPFPLELDHLPPFTLEVLRYLTTIPFGQTYSYQDVAKALNNPFAARAVGNACRVNPFPLLIPCHRVIGSHGTLGGFMGGRTEGLEVKKRLLLFEST